MVDIENINSKNDECLVPNSFDQISDTIKSKIKEKYNISDVDYQGSNISILTDMMAYAVAIGNTNLNFGIGESILELASSKRNIVSLARNLGYEPKRKTSYKYRIKLESKIMGEVTIPKYSTFKSQNGVPFVYLGDDTTMKFGYRCEVFVENQRLYETLKNKTSDDKGTMLVSNDGEIFEVLNKTSIGEHMEVLLAAENVGENLNAFSKQPTSIYKKMPKDYVPNIPHTPDPNNPDPNIAAQANPDVDFQYVRLGDIETYVLDDSDPDEPKLIIQMKNINPLEFLPADELINLNLFTDDIRYIAGEFEGFKCLSFDENSEVMVIDLNQYPIFEKISQYRKKRLALVGRNNPDLLYKDENLVLVLENISNVKDCELIVVQGEILSDETHPELRVIVNEEIQKQGYIVLDFEDIEQNGVFLEISRVNNRNELIIKQPFTQREEFLPPQGFNVEDTSFLVLNEFAKRYNYLKIFTAFANTGTKLYAGNICYFKLLKSLGTQGEAVGLIESDSLSDYLTAVPVELSSDGKPIDTILCAIGSDEEQTDTIKTNAPLFKNLAERLVTKRDYKTFLLSIPTIEKGQVWGGEELHSPMVGNVFFSFIPISRPTTFKSNENKTEFILENKDERGLFFLPENQILMEEDGGLATSIFEEISRRKIITLQFRYIPPSYIDFVIYVKVIKWQAGVSEIELRQKIFDRIHSYFKGIENFDSQIFESNLIKTIDLEFNNQSGIAIKSAMSVDIQKGDFFVSGENVIETDVNRYKSEFLFEFPADGIFSENVYNPDGSIGEWGKLILSQLPLIKSGNFIVDGDYLKFDYDNIEYVVMEQGKLVTKVGTSADITSNVKSFSIPIIHDCSNVDMGSEWFDKNDVCGALVAYPLTRVLHLEIYATDSKSTTDLETALPFDVFSVKKSINIECSINMSFKFQTFPKLKSVFFVSNF